MSTLLPTLIVNSKDAKKDDAVDTITMQDRVGWAMWGVGFLFECIADYQKSQFKSDPANHVSYFD